MFVDSRLLNRLKNIFTLALNNDKTRLAQEAINQLKTEPGYKLALCTIVAGGTDYSEHLKILAALELQKACPLQNEQCWWLLSQAYLSPNFKVASLVLESALQQTDTQILSHFLSLNFGMHGMLGVSRLLEMLMALCSSESLSEILMKYSDLIEGHLLHNLQAISESETLSEQVTYCVFLFGQRQVDMSSLLLSLQAYPIPVVLTRVLRPETPIEWNTLEAALQRCGKLSSQTSTKRTFFKTEVIQSVVYRAALCTDEEGATCFILAVFDRQRRHFINHIKDINLGQLQLGQTEFSAQQPINILVNRHPQLMDSFEGSQLITLWLNLIRTQSFCLTVVQRAFNSIHSANLIQDQEKLCAIYLLAQLIASRVHRLPGDRLIQLSFYFSELSELYPVGAGVCYDLVSCCAQNLHTIELDSSIQMVIAHLTRLNMSIWTHKPENYEALLGLIVHRLREGDSCHETFLRQTLTATVSCLLQLHKEGSTSLSVVNSMIGLMQILVERDALHLFESHCSLAERLIETALQLNLLDESTQKIELAVLHSDGSNIRCMLKNQFWDKLLPEQRSFYLGCLQKLVSEGPLQELTAAADRAIQVGTQSQQQFRVLK